jgi:hypothetical protein
LPLPRLRWGIPRAARDQLTPHLARAQADCKTYHAFLAQYAQLQAVVVSPDAAADVLRLRLAESVECRIEWMKVAAGTLAPSHAVAWLAEVEPLVMKGDVIERLALCESWQALSQRTG